MGTPFPGPFGFKYHPWAKEVHDSVASFNVSMKAAQMGLTEVAINRAFYTLDILKRDVLYVLPTTLNASAFSKGRFGPALEFSPYIKEMFTDINTVNLKRAHGNILYIRGSRGDSNLKSIPVSELILDEVDEMDMDQIWLALERLSGQVEQNVWAISTPKLPNKGIHLLYQDTTQEHFFFKCPHCSRQTELLWPDCVEVIGETLTDPRCHESYLKCGECKHKLDHEDKPNFLNTGNWQVTKHDANPDNRGFWISQLYSYTVTPGKIVTAHFRGLQNEGAMTEFHKSKLGLPYVSANAQILDTEVSACIKNHTKNDARPVVGGKKLITMGVDQGKWCYVEITEWFIEELSNDINTAAVAKVIWEGKFNEQVENGWARLDQFMAEWQVLHCIIDADPNALEARRFARRFPGYVTLCRYRSGTQNREIKVNKDERYAPIATVDRTNWMDAALGRFHAKRILLPRDLSLEYRDQIKSPVRTYDRDQDGNLTAKYVETGLDHFAHARTYSEIALPFAASIVTAKDIKAFL